VHVRVVDERRPGVVIRTRIFDIATERLVREETPQPPEENRPPSQRPDIPPPIERRPPDQPPPVQPPPANKPPEQPPPPAVQPPPENKPPEQRPPPPGNRPREEPRPPGPSSAATLDVPPGQLPELGECRVWIPGTPPGQQPRPKSRPCTGISAAAPAGSWVIYRPSEDKKVVHVRLVDPRRAGVVLRVRIFDIDTKQLVREENP
jgi:hypothetical protein